MIYLIREHEPGPVDPWALYVTREMLQKGCQWKIVFQTSYQDFLSHTIFQGLGERFRPNVGVEEHVIPTRVEDVGTRSARKMRLQVIPSRYWDWA